VTGYNRSAAIARFNEPDCKAHVFLLTTRAGGLGLNLQAANTVIIYDSDWNPQGDLQAIARCHRLGQQKEVKVYRLLTRQTAEATMFRVASRKLGLTNILLNGLHSKVCTQAYSSFLTLVLILILVLILNHSQSFHSLLFLFFLPCSVSSISLSFPVTCNPFSTLSFCTFHCNISLTVSSLSQECHT
jgi:Helicase conserved C-terminal domain